VEIEPFTSAAPALAALTQMGKLGAIKLATFDLNADVTKAIAAGSNSRASSRKPFSSGVSAILLSSQIERGAAAL